MTGTAAQMFVHDQALLDLAGVEDLAEALARWARAIGEVAAAVREPAVARALGAVAVDVEHLLDRFGPASVQRRLLVTEGLADAEEVGR